VLVLVVDVIFVVEAIVGLVVFVVVEVIVIVDVIVEVVLVVVLEVVRRVGVLVGGAVLVLVVFQVGDADAVELVEPGQRVGLLVLVGDHGAGEGLPGRLGAARGEQGLAVGVEEARGPGALLPVGQLG